jgi:hypothetical protein
MTELLLEMRREMEALENINARSCLIPCSTLFKKYGWHGYFILPFFHSSIDYK